jgi:uncharacterized protein YndB with AHSA1/START domain
MVREVHITRIVPAPRDRVWAAWTESEQLARWFMPHGFTVPSCEVDPRVGGAFHMTVRGPDGSESVNSGEFLEVDPPRRFVLTTSAFEDPEGVPMLEVRNTVMFTDLGDKTELSLHAVVTKAPPELTAPLAGMEEGWLQSLEKLDAALTGEPIGGSERRVVATRILDAPREVVWRAWTEAERVARWWAPPGFELVNQEMDVRPGGTWRHTLRAPDGTGIPATVTYVVLQEPEVLAYLYGNVGEPGHAFTTVELVDEGGKTAITVTLHFASAEERDRMVEENRAHQGLEGSLERLASVVTS